MELNFGGGTTVTRSSMLCAPREDFCEHCTCQKCITEKKELLNRIKQFREEKEELLKRIKQLEDKIETIWMHPDMPGGKLEFIEAQEELEESMSHKK